MIQTTSIAAYQETNLSREAMCQRLMSLYEKSPNGLTDNEAGRLLGWHPSQVSARRADLGSVIFNQDDEVRRDPYTRKANKVWRKYYPITLF